MTHLRHPETGGQFDAPPRAVPTYLRSGWTEVDPASPVGETGGSSSGTAGSVGPTPPAETPGPDQES